MKTIFTFFVICAALLHGHSHAQLLFIGAEDTLYGFKDSYKVEHGFDVENSGKVEVTVHIKREIQEFSPGYQQSFCWGTSCYAPSVDESVESVTIAPGQVEPSFLLDFYPNGKTGTLKVKYTFISVGSEGTETIEMDFVFIGVGDPLITGSETYCTGETSILTVPGYFDSYLWSDGSTTNSIQATAGSYSVEVSLHGTKKSTSTITVTEADSLTPVVPDEVGLCEGVTATLDAGPGFDSYSWNGTPGGSTFEATTAMESVVLEVSLNGCSGSKTVDVVDGTPTPPALYEFEGELFSESAAQYQWYFEGEPIDGVTEYKIELEQEGEYQVEVWSEFGCSNFSEPYEYVVQGMAESDVASTEIFPNPAQDIVQIRSPQPIASIALYDLTGKTVMVHTAHLANTLKLDVGILNAGIYLLEVETGSGDRLVERVVIK